MSNPIANPLLWSDGTSTPPATWNGTYFEVFGLNYGYTQVLTYIGPPITVPFDILITQRAPDEEGLFTAIADGAAVAGTDSNIYSNPVEYGTPRTITVPACAAFELTIEGSYISPNYDYACDMTFEAPGAPPVSAVWTDFVGTAEQ